MKIFRIFVLQTMRIAKRIFVSRGKLKIWHVIRLKCVRRNCVIVFLKRLLGRRFSFRSLGRREEQGVRKTERERERVGDERAGNRKEIQVPFQHRFRSAAKRFCEFELKFHQATTPLLFLAIIVPHRIHVAPFFLPSAPLLLSAASTVRGKPIRGRHPAERQRLLVYPRSPSKCEVVVGYADRSAM